MLKVFIMEDNLQQLNNLQAVVKTILLKLQVTDSLVLPFSSTTSLNKSLPEPSADNVFILDLQINHNKRAGLQLSQLIRQRDPEASIIFITVHDELLYTTYKYRVQALDFISKDQDNIEQELMKDFRLITRQHQKRQKIFFTTPAIIRTGPFCSMIFASLSPTRIIPIRPPFSPMTIEQSRFIRTSPRLPTMTLGLFGSTGVIW